MLTIGYLHPLLIENLGVGGADKARNHCLAGTPKFRPPDQGVNAASSASGDGQHAR
jgi:hypothetical protein